MKIGEGISDDADLRSREGELKRQKIDRAQGAGRFRWRFDREGKRRRGEIIRGTREIEWKIVRERKRRDKREETFLKRGGFHIPPLQDPTSKIRARRHCTSWLGL